ncbi:MAG: hypothetical protein ABI746_07825 [Dermatophilaceae bacterium]
MDDGLTVIGGIDVDVDDLHLLSGALRAAARAVAEIASSVASLQAGMPPSLLLASAARRPVGGPGLVAAVAGLGVVGGPEAQVVSVRLAALGLRVARAAAAYDGAESQIVSRVAEVDDALEAAAIAAGYLANLLTGAQDGGPWRGADPDSLSDAAGGALAGLYPHRAIIVGPARDLGAVPVPTGIADLIRAIDGHPELTHEDPTPGRVDVLAVTSAAGETSYVVALPGTSSLRPPITPYADDEPRDMRANFQLVAGRTTAEMEALPGVLAAAGVPAGARVALVGHSQGGLTAYASAGYPALRERYRISHVVSAGSPVAAMAAPRGVRVLSLENTDDVVPRLDGRANSSSGGRTTVSFPSMTQGGAHDLGQYEAAAVRVDAAADPRLAGFRDSLARADFLPGPGGTARLARVELTLERPR